MNKCPKHGPCLLVCPACEVELGRAFEKGRKAGLEEAAKVAEDHPTGRGADPLPLLIRKLALYDCQDLPRLLLE